MPDCCMCDDNKCPRKLECYRFTAEPNPWRQSYFVGSPRDDLEKDECKYFSPNGKEPNVPTT